jgi:hypothetical protein
MFAPSSNSDATRRRNADAATRSGVCQTADRSRRALHPQGEVTPDIREDNADLECCDGDTRVSAVVNRSRLLNAEKGPFVVMDCAIDRRATNDNDARRGQLPCLITWIQRDQIVMGRQRDTR